MLQRYAVIALSSERRNGSAGFHRDIPYGTKGYTSRRVKDCSKQPLRN
jgi:hypothetical protein